MVIGRGGGRDSSVHDKEMSFISIFLQISKILEIVRK